MTKARLENAALRGCCDHPVPRLSLTLGPGNESQERHSVPHPLSTFWFFIPQHGEVGGGLAEQPGPQPELPQWRWPGVRERPDEFSITQGPAQAGLLLPESTGLTGLICCNIPHCQPLGDESESRWPQPRPSIPGRQAGAGLQS